MYDDDTIVYKYAAFLPCLLKTTFVYDIMNLMIIVGELESAPTYVILFYN